MKIRLNYLQIVRGFAALIVVLWHAHVVITNESKIAILKDFKGYLGVPLFFMVSGFIMVYTTQKQSDNPKKNVKDFLFKRIFRIVPLYYFAILMFFIVNLYNPISFAIHNLGMMTKMMFFLPLFSDHIGPFYGPSFLYVSWSLNYEMMFYGIFAISLLFKKYRYIFLYAFFSIIIFVIPIVTVGYFNYNYSVYYNFKIGFFNFFTNPISLLFILGVSFGLLIKRIKLPLPVIIVFAILSSLLFLTYFLSVIPVFFGSDTLFCALLILSLLLLDLNLNNSNPPKAFTYLGDISYSIYLMHPLVFMVLLTMIKSLHWQAASNSWYFLAFAFIAIISVSAFTYEIIEKRFTSILRLRFLNT